MDKALEIFTNNITGILDEMAPMRTLQIRTNYAPWLSEETLELIKARDEAHKVAVETKCRDDWKKIQEG